MRVFACMASSLDGKIGPARTDHFVSITSRYDLEHLESIRDQADGILFGASTFRAWPKVHLGHKKGQVAHHFILSHSLRLDPEAPLFQNTSVMTTIFTGLTRESVTNSLPDHIKIVTLTDRLPVIEQIIDHIKTLGIRALLIEGGGQVLHQFIEARALQELYLTLAPLVIGQTSAPGLFGNKDLSQHFKLKLQQSRQVKDETYLHLKFNYTTVNTNEQQTA